MSTPQRDPSTLPSTSLDPAQTADEINRMHRGTWAEQMGLHLLSASRDEVVGKVEVQPRLHQPFGIIHGGVHAGLVESVASIGAGLDAFAHGKSVVGLENSTSFVRAVRSGTLHIVGKPITRGRRTQVWEVLIRNDEGAVVATGRVRLLVVEPDGDLGK